MTAVIDFEFDIDHPACGAIGVCSRQAGYINRDDLMQAFEDSDVPAALYPTVPGNSVALKRALKDMCMGNPSLRVESKGKGIGAVYSIVNTDKDKIDLEEGNGIGIADAIVTARIHRDEKGVETLRVTPPHMDRSELVEKFNFHRKHFKCSVDLSQYVSQKLLRSHLIGAVSRPGHGGGLYFVPKGDGADLLNTVKAVFDSVSKFNTKGGLIEGVKISVIPMITSCPDVVDLLTDSVLDDAESAIASLNEELCRHEELDNLGMRALESRLARVKELNTKVQAFTKSCGDAFTDLEPQMRELEVNLNLAMLKAID